MTVTTGSFTPTTNTNTQPTPAHLTRKINADQVLITGWASHKDGISHTVLATWPTHHPLYTSHHDVYHPLILAESIRQALTMLSHTAHGVPLDHRLGWQTFDTSIVTAALNTSPGPGTIRMTITHTEAQQHRRGSRRFAAQIMATRDDQPLGIARIRYIAHPPALYNRLRGTHADAHTATTHALPPGPALPLAERGQQTPLQQAVLSPLDKPHQWQLRVDVTNRIFFDHDHDHVPGILLLEAAAQAAHAESHAVSTLPTSFNAHFHRYVELDTPCHIASHPEHRRQPGQTSTLITGHQNNQHTFTIHTTTTTQHT
ncbi:ScbA/BarX family gamma-butyrolactone biosynthesis protein [Streptomyces sp. NPDC006267]|uniref:ScbA/BarX family gamma-butyrolactone biosynthesis protein n=1 Tax=Streptomyces sp. NPDC006267 TaxID=3157173 RepID=UPI0033B2454E